MEIKWGLNKEINSPKLMEEGQPKIGENDILEQLHEKKHRAQLNITKNQKGGV